MRLHGQAPLGRGLWKSALISVVVMITALAACSESPGTTATWTGRPVASPTEAGEASGLTIVLATTDLAVGQNRVAFAVLDDGGVLEPDEAYATFSPESGEAMTDNGVQATYRQWPGSRGLFTVQAEFDAPGVWQLEVDATLDGTAASGSVRFQVNPESSSTPVGAAAPASRNKTLGDVARIEELTTDPAPDEGLYAMTIAEALEAGKPLVVTFATPAFCKTATCGPQVDVLKDLRARYAEQISFVHIEVFDNPVEMGGDLTKGRLSPVVDEWGLKTEPFTFVVDSSGRVAAKFEAFASAEELVEVIEKTLA